jgi:hypothetical protein
MPENGTSQTWRVTTSSGIRIRDIASLDGEIRSRFAVGSRFVQTGALVEADGYLWAPHSEGFSAVQEVGGDAFAVIVTDGAVIDETHGETANRNGVHLDPLNPVGKPSVEALGGIHWLRINYDVSFDQGHTDIHAAFQFYEPICRPYLEAGKRIIFVLTHETFGENVQGLPQFRPQEFAPFVAEIVSQWKVWGRQIVWEIWNEPDLGFNRPDFDPKAKGNASVSLTPAQFADLLKVTIQKIRAVDPAAVVISGGLMTGQPDYLAKTLSHLAHEVRLDGIAIHPYGQDTKRDPRFGPHGDLKTLMTAYKKNAGDIPLYITEWGVLGQPEIPAKDVALYAQRFLDASGEFAECAVWFAWADTMHDGYGLVEANQTKKEPLYRVFAN